MKIYCRSWEVFLLLLSWLVDVDSSRSLHFWGCKSLNNRLRVIINLWDFIDTLVFIFIDIKVDEILLCLFQGLEGCGSFWWIWTINRSVVVKLYLFFLWLRFYANLKRLVQHRFITIILNLKIFLEFAWN
jgi:hypothetical protein